ncbi:MAG: peptide chain release factor N(5)-glutamine methyltransferase, partial [bacterium]
LTAIRPLVEQAPQHLKDDGYQILEFGIDHARPVSEIAGQTQAYSQPEVIIDYNQQPRGVVLRRI